MLRVITGYNIVYVFDEKAFYLGCIVPRGTKHIFAGSRKTMRLSGTYTSRVDIFKAIITM